MASGAAAGTGSCSLAARFAGHLRTSWRENRIYLGLVAAYIATVVAAGAALGFDVTLVYFLSGFASFSLIVFVLVLVAALVVALWRARPEHPLAFAGRFIASERTVARILLGLPVVLTYAVFASAFSSFKVAIGQLNPYVFDPAFAAIDRALHGGDPWHLAIPLLESPALLQVLDRLYGHGFFVVLFVMVGCVAFWVERPRLRERFLIAFALMWIGLGSAGALAMSSVGPCYYELFYGEPRFAPLIAYLEDASAQRPLAALHAQQFLTAQNVNEVLAIGAGISAMPSMHVAMAVLLCCLSWHVSRILFALSLFWLALTQLGSVVLGWHYAIDGYFSMVAVPLLWVLVGRWLARRRGPESCGRAARTKARPL